MTFFLKYLLWLFVTLLFCDSSLHLNNKIWRESLLWRPSCHHIWRGLIVPPDFSVAKPAKQFLKCELPFPLALKSCTHIGYRTVNHAVLNDNMRRSRQMILPNDRAKMIVPNDRAKSEGTITHLHMWRSIWPLPHSTGVKKKRLIPLFKFFDLNTNFFFSFL